MGTMRLFNRGLSDLLVIELRSGRFVPLLAESLRVGLDVQIREDYLNFYHNGLSILALSRHTSLPCFRVRIHWKYLDGIELPREMPRAGDYRRFDASLELVEMLIRRLPILLKNAALYAGPEAIVEEKMIRGSHNDSSGIAFIDRQVQVPGVRTRADLVGLTAEGQLVVTEVKQGLDNRIQHLMDQIRGYYVVLTDPCGCLREDVANAYRRVVEQKHSLGLLPQHVRPPVAGAAVKCLLVLYGYNPLSKLLARLRLAAATGSLPVDLVMLSEQCYDLPPATVWERLCPAK